MVLEFLHIRGFLKIDRQAHDAVPDPLIEHAAALLTGLIAGQLVPYPGRRKVVDVIIKQCLENLKILPGQTVQGTACGSRDFTGSCVGIFIICQTEGQETVPEIPLKPIVHSQFNQLSCAVECIRPAAAVRISHKAGHVLKQLLIFQIPVYD